MRWTTSRLVPARPPGSDTPAPARRGPSARPRRIHASGTRSRPPRRCRTYRGSAPACADTAAPGCDCGRWLASRLGRVVGAILAAADRRPSSRHARSAGAGHSGDVTSPTRCVSCGSYTSNCSNQRPGRRRPRHCCWHRRYGAVRTDLEGDLLSRGQLSSDSSGRVYARRNRVPNGGISDRPDRHRAPTAFVAVHPGWTCVRSRDTRRHSCDRPGTAPQRPGDARSAAITVLAERMGAAPLQRLLAGRGRPQFVRRSRHRRPTACLGSVFRSLGGRDELAQHKSQRRDVPLRILRCVSVHLEPIGRPLGDELPGQPCELFMEARLTRGFGQPG